MRMGTNKVIQVDKDGFLEEVDLDTGETKQLETTKELALVESPKEPYKIIRDKSGKLAYIPANATTETIRSISGNNYVVPYSRLTALQICHEVANGKTLKKVLNSSGMPTYAQLGEWKRSHPEFAEWLKIAKEDAGEYYFDKVMEETEMAVADKEELALSKLKTDIYKYAAKVSNPDSFSEKRKLEVEGQVTHFVVETGVRRVGDSGFNEQEIRDVTKEIEGNDD